MYEIIRTEVTPNREGIDELFVQISITDDLGTYPFAKWLSVAEKLAYDKEEDKLNELVEGYLPQARESQLAEIEYIKNNPPKDN